MIRVLITNLVNSVEKDYTKYVQQETIKIVKTLNAPSVCTFQMNNFDSKFEMPIGRSYIRVVSTQRPQALFTGYMPAEPTKVYSGLNRFYVGNKRQLFNLAFSYTSDEYLINIKSVPRIPAYINMHAGTILQKLAEYLCPGLFTFDNCQPGVLVPYQAYDPTKSWSELAKQFGDASRYRYHCINHEIHFVPYGDQPLGIAYDEDGLERSFNAAALTTSPLVVPVVNDVIVIGQQEAGNNHEDYFIGDGFTSAFPLRHQVFNAGATDGTNGIVVISDDWSQNQIDENVWESQDPQGNLNPIDGSMNIVTPVELPNQLGESYIKANQAIELAGGVVIQHGEFTFNNASRGLIGGLYTAESLDPATCLCGFMIDYGPNVDVSASGAAGITITPYAPNPDLTNIGSITPISVVTKINKTYVLTTTIAAVSPSRYTQVYSSLGGVVYGGTSLSDKTTGTITWKITETDIFTGEILEYSGSLPTQPLPAYCVYALINNISLNCNFNATQVYTPPMGSLNINSEVGSGLLNPIYISGNLQYEGAYVTPSGGNLPILPTVLGQEHTWPLGSSLQDQSAEIDVGDIFSTLNFYSDNIPGVGVRIRLNSWESQAAISRVQDTNSIEIESGVVGDDGIRAAQVTNLSPAPRTSEDCDAAAQAYLSDRVNTYFNGSYNIESTFMQQFTNDLEFYPVPGRYIYINASERGLSKQKLLVSDITITVKEMVSEILLFAINFGADLKLEKTLSTFVETPDNVLLQQNTAIALTPQQLEQVGAKYLPDVQKSNIDSTTIAGASCILNLQDDFPALTGTIVPNAQAVALAPPFYEIRISDFNWGVVNGQLIGRFYSNGPISLQRYGYENIFYIRLVQLDTEGNLVAVSRRSKVLRMYYPNQPSPPTFLYADSTVIRFDYNGDIRNIEGIELAYAALSQGAPYGGPGSGGGNPVPPIIIKSGGFTAANPLAMEVAFSGGGGVRVGIGAQVSSDVIPDSVAEAVTNRFGGFGVVLTEQAIIYQGIVGSEADMAFDLNALRGDIGVTGSNLNAGLGKYQKGTLPPGERNVVVRFFNLMWERSPSVAVSIPLPENPVIVENFKFGAALNVGTSGTSRPDIQATHLQVAKDSGFTELVLETEVAGPNGTFSVTVPSNADLYARACFIDFISSGGWSNTLHVAQKDLINSNYLASQGSIPPAVTSINGAVGGGLLTWVTTNNSITISNAAFTLQYPDGTKINVGVASRTFTKDIDTGGALVAGALYGFFPAIQGAVTATPTFLFNGPYKNYTSASILAALGTQVADGSTPLSVGVIAVQMQTSSSSGSGTGGGTTGGGGGGGTGGGANCGIMSSKITVGNGTKCTLSKTHVGMKVLNVKGRQSRIKFRTILTEETVTIELESGNQSTAALGHSVYSNGKWRHLDDVISLVKEEEIVTLRNELGIDEKIKQVYLSGKQKICRIELEPIDSTLDEAGEDFWHVYILDGLMSHNLQKL